MNQMVKADEVPSESAAVPDQPIVREIHIGESRTRAAAAEVRKVRGKWKAVRLDDKPRWEDSLGPRQPDAENRA